MPGQAKVLLDLGPRLLRPQPALLDVRRGHAQGTAQLRSTSSRMLSPAARPGGAQGGDEDHRRGPVRLAARPARRGRRSHGSASSSTPSAGIDSVVEGEGDVFVKEHRPQGAPRRVPAAPRRPDPRRRRRRSSRSPPIRYPQRKRPHRDRPGLLPRLLVLLGDDPADPVVPAREDRAGAQGQRPESGFVRGLLHSDDVFFYGSPNVMPREEKLLPLLQLAKRYYDQVGWSHVAIASLMTKPKLLPQVRRGPASTRSRTGGASRSASRRAAALITAAMPGKVAPFKASQWPELVVQAAGLMNDNHVYPACTFIVGLPQETEDDVLKTIELFDDLWDFKAILVPMFFVPLGHLKSRDWFRRDRLSTPRRSCSAGAHPRAPAIEEPRCSDFFELGGRPQRRVPGRRSGGSSASSRSSPGRTGSGASPRGPTPRSRAPCGTRSGSPIPTIPVRE